MPNRITEINLAPVRGGTEVRGMARSDRGSRYIVGSIVVLRAGKSKQEFRAAIARAAENIYKGSA